MIVLDTNVLSAMLKAEVDPAIAGWLNESPSDVFWLTSITVFEIRFGLERMPNGRRRRELEFEFSNCLVEDFQHRVLSFDANAAAIAGEIAARRQAAGKTGDFRDTQIAGIAVAHQATLATRNIRHFDDLPIEVVNPWND